MTELAPRSAEILGEVAATTVSDLQRYYAKTAAAKAALSRAEEKFREAAKQYRLVFADLAAAAKDIRHHNCHAPLVLLGAAAAGIGIARDLVAEGLKLIRQAGFKVNLAWATAF